jgi:hypothetical protein
MPEKQKNIKNIIRRDILEKLKSNDLVHERWIDSLSEILEVSVKIFGGGTTYCIHSCVNEGKTIHFETGGPSNEAHYAKRKDSEDRGIDQGLIGKSIRENQSYTLCNDVSSCNSYIPANPDTCSELVIIIPSFVSNTPLGIINLESKDKEVFNEDHGLIFSMIANWAGQRERELRMKKMLGSIASLPSELHTKKSNYARRNSLFSEMARLSSDIIQSDTFAVSLLETGDQGSYYKVIDHSNYPKSLLELTKAEQRRSVPAYTFRDHERDREASGEPTIHLYEAAKNFDSIESNIDSSLSYFLSICFDYELEGAKKVAALILGFEKNPEVNREIRDKLKFLTKIIIWLTHQFGVIDDNKALLSAMKKLSEANTNSIKNMGSLLNNFAEQIVEILHCSGFIFYELKEDINAGESLIELGSYIGERSNIFWREYFITKKLAYFKKLKKENEGFWEFSADIESKNDPQKQEKYNIFVRSIRLHKQIFIVSLKKLKDYHESIVLSSTSRTILDARIIALESFVKNRLRENSTEYSLLGFRQLISIWFKQVSESAGEKKDREFALFTATHNFLQDWIEVAGTPYSAIFLASGTSLEMSEASMKHLKCAGQAPLKFSANPIGQVGLTQMVWKNQESILSFSVATEGNQECQSFWKTVTNSPPDQRFFAGALITGKNVKDRNVNFGVLTINGDQPTYDITQFSMKPSILPMLEIIAEELGKQLQISKI